MINDSHTVTGVSELCYTITSFQHSIIMKKDWSKSNFDFFYQVILADGTQVQSSVVLSNATPYKTFMVTFFFYFHSVNIL